MRVKVTLPLTASQYALVQDQLIAAVAAAAGVPSSAVSVSRFFPCVNL